MRWWERVEGVERGARESDWSMARESQLSPWGIDGAGLGP